LHWAIPALTSAASKAFKGEMGLTAQPLVTKTFFGRKIPCAEWAIQVSP